MVYRNPSQVARAEAKRKLAADYHSTGSIGYGILPFRFKGLSTEVRDKPHMSVPHLQTNPTAEYGARWATGTLFEGRVLNHNVGRLLTRSGHENTIRASQAKSLASSVDRRLPILAVQYFRAIQPKIMLQKRLGSYVPLHKELQRGLHHKGYVWRAVMDFYEIELYKWSLDEAIEKAADDIAAFYEHPEVTKMHFSNDDDAKVHRWNCLKLVTFDADGNDQEKPTWLGNLQARFEELVERVALAFETLDFSDPELRPGFEEWSQYCSAVTSQDVRKGRQKPFVSNLPSHQLPQKDDEMAPLTAFDMPNHFTFHKPELIQELLGFLPRVEQQLALLAVGRTALGKHLTRTGKVQDLSDWRYAMLLDGAPRVGKSSFLEMLMHGLEHYGLTHKPLPGRLSAGFGFDVFTANAVIKDDMAAKDFVELSQHGMVKTAISGGTVVAERKGKDATEAEASAVLWLGINGLSQYDGSNADDGIKSRVIVLTTKRLAIDDQTQDLLVTQNARAIWEPTLQKIAELYPGHKPETVLGAYLVACGVHECMAVAVTRRVSEVVEELRTRAARDLQAQQSISVLANVATELAGASVAYLQNTKNLTDDQANQLLRQLADRQAAVDLAQFALPLNLAAGWAIAYEAPEVLQERCPGFGKVTDVLTSGRFRPTGSHLTFMRDGSNVRMVLGDLKSLPPEEKLAEKLASSVKTPDYLTGRLSRVREVFSEAMRAAGKAYQHYAQMDATELETQLATLLGYLDKTNQYQVGLTLKTTKSFLGLL